MLGKSTLEGKGYEEAVKRAKLVEGEDLSIMVAVLLQLSRSTHRQSFWYY